MKSWSAASGRLKELIRQAEKGEISKEKAAAAALSIARAALRNVRHGVSNDGVPYSYDDPKYEASTTALIAGLRIAAGEFAQPEAPVVKGKPETDAELVELATKELAARGYEVTPRGRA